MDHQAAMITFGTYGSWLHGDIRGSWQRDTSELQRNDMLRGYERSQLTQPAVQITPRMRPVIELAILEVCARRDWCLRALNVRTQHVHVVLSGAHLDQAPTACKAFATRRLRDDGLEPEGSKVWARSGSLGVLRTEESVWRAIDYVRRGQGAVLDGSIFLR